MMYVSLVFMLVVLAAALVVIVKFTFLIQERVMHNRCHTDNMQIEDLHGHTEPHVYIGIVLTVARRSPKPKVRVQILIPMPTRCRSVW